MLDTEAGDTWCSGMLDVTTADLDDWSGPILPRKLEGTENLTPACVSPDGRRIGGYAIDESGESTLAVFEVATARIELLRRKDGRYFRPWGDPTWLGNDRIVFWDAELDQAIVWDVDDREARVVEGVPGPSSFRFTADGRTMVVNHAAQESDIWLLTLAE
jgi:hypothetical protein